MNDDFNDHAIDNEDSFLSTNNDLSPIININDDLLGQNIMNDLISVPVFLENNELGFENELTQINDKNIIGLEQVHHLNELNGLNDTSFTGSGFDCSAGCAGNCAGSCAETCADSCYNRCKSSYSS
ncbi:MAG: hypothetical protein HXX16_10225 [Bacteroidales bacterium]|nr:hypothetical protein [Bacteroidales bacterium]